MPEYMIDIPNCKKGHPRKRTPSGSIICPQCRNEDRAANRDKYRAQGKRHWEANKDKIKTKRDNRPPERKAEISEYMRSYRQEHKEELSEKAKLFREENAERINTQRAGFREQNRERLASVTKEYYQNTREERLEYAKVFRDERMTPYYKIWDGIIQRCYNKNCTSYSNYGGRGITIHEPWRESYKEFEDYIVNELGPKPTPDHSLDRYPDRNGNYEPGNLRWATWKEQAENTRRNLNYKKSIPEESPISYNNKIYTLKEFSEITGLHLTAVKYRYAQHPGSADWILHDEWDNRYYKYEGHKYNMTELSLISGMKYTILISRILRYNWSIERAMNVK